MSSAAPPPHISSPLLPILAAIALVAAVLFVALIWFLIAGSYFAAFGHWMHESDFGSLLSHVLESLVLLVCVLLPIAALIYFERKVWAAVQLRRGPNVVGPWGTHRPFADFIKFMTKEPVISSGANKGVFVLAPLVSVMLAFAPWAVIPVNDGWIPGFVWFLIKLWSVVFIFSMVKAFAPRYRYDQLMRLGWKVFLPISLVMVVLVAAVLEFTGLGGRVSG
jgi:NADH-quinone oxidoreductase subunit H